MVFCPNCGSSLKDTAKFCIECGTRLDEFREIKDKVESITFTLSDNDIKLNEIFCPKCNFGLGKDVKICPICNYELISPYKIIDEGLTPKYKEYGRFPTLKQIKKSYWRDLLLQIPIIPIYFLSLFWLPFGILGFFLIVSITFLLALPYYIFISYRPVVMERKKKPYIIHYSKALMTVGFKDIPKRKVIAPMVVYFLFIIIISIPFVGMMNKDAHDILIFFKVVFFPFIFIAILLSIWFTNLRFQVLSQRYSDYYNSIAENKPEKPEPPTTSTETIWPEIIGRHTGFSSWSPPGAPPPKRIVKTTPFHPPGTGGKYAHSPKPARVEWRGGQPVSERSEELVKTDNELER